MDFNLLSPSPFPLPSREGDSIPLPSRERVGRGGIFSRKSCNKLAHMGPRSGDAGGASNSPISEIASLRRQ